MNQQTPSGASRPKNRKALIIRAAGTLFYQRGYAAVGMSEIAASVGIAPSALYRHFRGKEELLKAVIENSLSQIITPIEQLKSNPEADSPEIWASYFAEVALNSREAGVLWRRESRRLPAEELELLQARISFMQHELAAKVRSFRAEAGGWAELLARAQLSVFASISFHRTNLRRDLFSALLADIVLSVLKIKLPENSFLTTETERRPTDSVLSTREQLLAVGAELFAERGFAAVSTGEVAAAVGIAGPSIYHHFSSKSEILFLSLERAGARLRSKLEEVLATAADASEALNALMRSYLKMILEEPHLIILLITELDHLSQDSKEVIRAEQRDYVSRWVGLLRELHPELDEESAWIRAHASITVINQRLGGRREALRSGELAGITSICQAILRLT
ncbi:TetR/AcrR family transcriptional regulator [Psychromicrobium sp. YIM B11713]|uniref:TetR/AcrR family transcriptional regulator n=1 Tax=Psychromicrobium sp. YIM B11713 TaxID=3145233 RepID=UPI00374E9ADB